MQGRTYYLTTLLEWQQASARFTISHYIHADPSAPMAPHTRILAIIEADEATHNSLAQNPAWDELPHPLSQQLIPEAAAAALTAHGVTSFHTTFEATESIAKNYPILRYRVF